MADLSEVLRAPAGMFRVVLVDDARAENAFPVRDFPSQAEAINYANAGNRDRDPRRDEMYQVRGDKGNHIEC